jgi:hypothetical protein
MATPAVVQVQADAFDASDGHALVDRGVMTTGTVTVRCSVRLVEGADLSCVSCVCILDDGHVVRSTPTSAFVRDGDVWRVGELIELPDGEHHLCVEVRDDGGAVTKAALPTCVVDLDAPSLELAVSDVYTSGSVMLDVLAQDSALVMLQAHAVRVHGGETSSRDISLDAVSGDKANVSFDEPGSWNVRVEACDAGGRRVTQEQAFVIDRDPPVISEVTMSTLMTSVVQRDDGHVEWHCDSPVQLKFVARDVTDDETSGSLSLSTGESAASLRSQADVRGVNGELDLMLETGEELLGGATVLVADRAGNSISWSLDDVGVTQTGLPEGGRADRLVVDTQPPRLEVVAPGEGAYVSEAQDAVVRVQDDRLASICDGEALWGAKPGGEIFVTRDGAPYCTVPFRGLPCSEDGRQLETGCALTEDGVYSISVSCMDAAGHVATPIVRSFVIDQTAPDLSITFDGTMACNGSYYASPRNATVVVDECNFDSALVAIDTNGRVGTWADLGDRHQVEVCFDQEGPAHLDVTATDRAGNRAQASGGTFTLDFTAPVVTFDGVEDGCAYRGDLSPSCSIFDDNADPATESVTLSGSEHDELALAAEEADGAARRYATPAFSHEQETDDVYTLQATAHDLAGNETVATCSFSVNRFGSTYRILPVSLDYLAGFEGSGQRCYADEVLVEEVNVCDLVSHQVFVARDDTIVSVPEVKDAVATNSSIGPSYSCEEEDDGSAWHSYLYTLSAQTFRDEGTYRVMINSMDRAGNASSNTLERAGAPIALVIDNTPPVIWTQGVASGETVDSDDARVLAHAFDNVRLSRLSAWLDGGEVQAGSQGDAAIDLNEVPDGTHDVTFVATDAAGNETRVGVGGIEVRHGTDSRVPVARLVAGGAALAAVAAFVISRRAKGGDAADDGQ